jgi:hypothetical protein
MDLTDNHVLQYHEEGYCLIKGLIPPELMEAVHRRAMEIVEDPPDWPARHFHVVDPERYRTAKGVAMPLGIQIPALMDEVFRVVADHPNFVEAMSRLLGGEVKRYTDQIGVKHGKITEEQGARSFYHQDSYYWHIGPQLGCNAWVPTTRVGSDAIALAVMPGSHRDWVLADHESYFDDPAIGHFRDGFTPIKRHRIPLEKVDFSREVLVPMDPGDGLFFTNYTWHRSEPNRTGESKSFYGIAYKRTSS